MPKSGSPCISPRVSKQVSEAFQLACRRRQEKAALAEAKEMAGQLETNIEEGDIYQLPGEEDEDEGGAPDLPSVLRRIREVARVLDNFKVLRDAKRSRSEYLDQVNSMQTIRRPCMHCRNQLAHLHIIRVNFAGRSPTVLTA